MTDDELAISRSTPGARFDAPAPRRRQRCARLTPPAAPVEAPEVSAEVEELVARLLADSEQPLVLFALEWCEFCWSLRKLFAHCGIPYRSVDLDSTAYQRDDRGGQIRAVLYTVTGSRSIPQVFVGGEFIGGATETMQAFKDGRLQSLLKQRGVSFDEDDGDRSALPAARLDPDRAEIARRRSGIPVALSARHRRHRRHHRPRNRRHRRPSLNPAAWPRRRSGWSARCPASCRCWPGPSGQVRRCRGTRSVTTAARRHTPTASVNFFVHACSTSSAMA